MLSLFQIDVMLGTVTGQHWPGLKTSHVIQTSACQGKLPRLRDVSHVDGKDCSVTKAKNLLRVRATVGKEEQEPRAESVFVSVRFPEAIKFCAKQARPWYLCLEVTSVQLFLSGPPCPSPVMTNRGPE